MRRRRATSEWRAIVEEYRKSGETQKEFCQERGLSVSSLQNHLRSEFVEVSQPTSSRATELEVSFPDGTVVRIRG